MSSSIRLVRLPATSCRFSPRTSRVIGCCSRSQLNALPALARYYASKSFPPHSVVSMPALSPTMQAGNIGAWQKKPGDAIAPGDVLVEIETDKAQMDFEFQEEGTLAKILKDTGEKDVAVGSPIAVMVEEGADVSAFESFTIEDAGGDKTPPKDAPEEEASESSEPPGNEGSNTAVEADGKSEGKNESSSKKKSEGKEEGSKKSEESTPQSQESDSTGSRLQTSLSRMPKLSLSAQKLAADKGVPIGKVKGTGRGGQVTKSDVEKFKGSSPAASPAAAAAGSGAPSYEDIEATSMRKTIAKRLTESMNQNPHYFVASTISVTKMLKLRQALNAAADGKYKLSVNDLLIKACAIACRKVPAANSSWREADGKTFIRQHNTVDVSVAVATPIGLMTPIVKGADGLGLESISAQVKDLGKRARDGKLKPEEYQGGTVTISNMGMNDAIDRFTAVINPPQACIIAIGTTKKVPIPGVEGDDGVPSVEWDDQIVITGSFDHKVVDGAVGGEFMRELKKAVENPLNLML